MYKQSKWIVIPILLIILLISLGCIFLSQETQSETVSPLPTEDPGVILTQISSAAATASSGGRIVLELSEGQLTAAANQELQRQGLEEIQDIRVGLADGLVTITGQVNQNGLDLPLLLSLSIEVDEQGVPSTQVHQGKLGPFPIPQNMLEQFKVQFDQILQAQINATAGNLSIETISVNDGKITIVADAR